MVAVQFPVTTGPSFNQVVDVLKMKLYQWGPEGGGKPEVLDIPESLMDKRWSTTKHSSRQLPKMMRIDGEVF